MASACVVPNCESTVGIHFPENDEIKKQWLDSLKITIDILNPTSVICLKHFEKEAIYDSFGPDGSIIKNVKDGAIPTVVTPQDQNETKLNIAIDEDTSNTVSENFETTKQDPDQLIEECNGIEHQENNLPEVHEDKQTTKECNGTECNENNDKEDAHEDEQGQGCSKEEVEPMQSSCDDKPNVSEDIISKEVIPEIETEVETAHKLNTCRLCGIESPDTKNIYQERIENVPVSVVIMECIYPIEILENDHLSKEICEPCLNTLISYFKFRTICLENDKKQRDICDEENDKNMDVPTCTTSNQNKRKGNETHLYPTVIKKQRVEEIITDSEEDFSEQDDLDSLSDFIVKKDVTVPPDKQPNKPLAQNKNNLIVIPKQIVPKSTKIDQKFDKVEEELRKVIEGQLTEEQAKAENIIIHVQNDEGSSQDKMTLKNLKLPIVIKPISTEKLKGEAFKVVSNRKIISGDEKLNMKMLKMEPKLVALPKNVRLRLNSDFSSNVGLFQGTRICYLFETEFCQVDGYLFEYRLCKGNTRFMRCLLPPCQALATQAKLGPGRFSLDVTVQVAHNHQRPDASEKKKQMFHYVMKRKMQCDKTLNFRSVYEEVCKCDSEIQHLVPLRNVINEICRHQFICKLPQIDSFEQFYDHIEDDSFQKLHFTHNRKQFYQEKFVAEDNSKAIVFANNDIIEQVANSNLMYVDSSFKIDSKEEFQYQLVTVLVWIDESYYPILFALINKKTQEIYKKIFEYLHDVLAPTLRPEEIVTDYEANLYYALGETYLHSSIGGSVFYYTQNLYKKICSLKLSRELETNSYFRNIYHMLLMLPLLPVNTILDGLNNVEIQAKDMGLTDLSKPIFDHVHDEWIANVTPDLFCVHRLENRINENVIAPFKKLRDLIMLSKGKVQKQYTTVVTVVEKLIELEHFLQVTYSTPNKKSFARDLSSSQKKNVLKAWQYIESHPKININNFFSKVLGYIKCMENQLWIWGFYRYTGDVGDDLINATNFSIVSNDVEVETHNNEIDEPEFIEGEDIVTEESENGQVVMEAVIDENGSFVLQNKGNDDQSMQFENSFFKYVCKE